MMITGQNTQLFALVTTIKSWEMKIAHNMRMGALRTHNDHKSVALGHMKSLFKVDDSFDALEGRECYNSIVGALHSAGIPCSSKEIYNEGEIDYMTTHGIDCSNVRTI